MVPGVALEHRRSASLVVRVARPGAGRRAAQQLDVDLLPPWRRPAWTLDEGTRQYWLHSFLPEQPDLNWDEPAVAEAMHGVLRFWLDRGVDGFRMDVVHKIGKDPELRDNEPGRRHDEDWPSVHGRLRAIRRVLDYYDGDRVAVGEVYVLDQRALARYVAGGDGLHLVHNFVFLNLPWSAAAFRATVDEFEELAGPKAWPAWCLGNHDHLSDRHPLWPRARPRRGDAAAHPSRHALPLSGRRARAAGRRGSARPRRRRRRAGPGALADPLGAAVDRGPRRGVHHRRAVAAASRPTPSSWPRRSRPGTPHRCSRCTARCLRCAAPRRRCARATTARSTPATTSSPTCAASAIAVALNFAAEPRPARASGRGRLLLSTRPAAPPGGRSTSPRWSSRPTRA